MTDVTIRPDRVAAGALAQRVARQAASSITRTSPVHAPGYFVATGPGAVTPLTHALQQIRQQIKILPDGNPINIDIKWWRDD
ncbi:hypothetical protein [Streptomyces longisporus]|uniref:Uncharacterized protein n=1 Tax=Streptomyces longisporus TaxID=1948 RepID=A0ABP6A763_STRLO